MSVDDVFAGFLKEEFVALKSVHKVPSARLVPYG